MYKFAIIEDSAPTNDSFRKGLEKRWLGCDVKQYFNTESAIQALQSETFDLVVTDLDLGDEGGKTGGFKVAKIIIQSVKCPLLVVSGAPEHDLYRGAFNALGAWDYLIKPVTEEDFVEQVRRALIVRDAQTGTPSSPQDQLSEIRDVPELKIDLAASKPAHWKGEPVHLTMSHVRIVHALASQPDQIVSYDCLWKLLTTGQNIENLRVHIGQIRRAFKDIDRGFKHINTVPYKGYLWQG